ncbi:hypothetical protein RJ639_013588 [Escallonia herrerae]|uniref:Retrotransposon gag domain-containing protein n=1 Tax=Escallonia herrerae TaxID=1293975 RepID=A0AA88VHF0_9ASTE|nr:hypothetical protein RJ639_013588 [Escallonia herrerae]
MDNFFWHLERYFEALDIDDCGQTVALWWRRRYMDGCDVKTWEKFKRELKRQFHPESVEDMAMINLRRLRQKESIREYMESSALMLEILEMFERQRICFFVDGLQHWVCHRVATEGTAQLGFRHGDCLESATALSTTEAEYMALKEAAKYALWLKGLVEELGFKQRSVLLQCDSQSAMDLAKNQIEHIPTFKGMQGGVPEEGTEGILHFSYGVVCEDKPRSVRIYILPEDKNTSSLKKQN